MLRIDPQKILHKRSGLIRDERMNPDSPVNGTRGEARCNPGATRASDSEVSTSFWLSSSHCDVIQQPFRSTADRSLLKGTNPSTSLRKDRASRFPSIATAESGLNHLCAAVGDQSNGSRHAPRRKKTMQRFRASMQRRFGIIIFSAWYNLKAALQPCQPALVKIKLQPAPRVSHS